MDDAQLMQRTQDLLSRVPQFSTGAPSLAEQRWIAQVRAVVTAMDDARLSGDLSSAMLMLSLPPTGQLRRNFGPSMVQILHNIEAQLAMRAPPAASNAFINVGSTFDALVAFAKVFETAKSKLLIVDPYADTKLLSDFAIQAPDNVSIQVLADKQSLKPTLKPAATAWQAQYKTRPLEVRASAPGALHDRLVIVDDADVWQTGQSFNHLAARSPTSLVRMEGALGKLKRDAYADIWNTSVVI